MIQVEIEGNQLTEMEFNHIYRMSQKAAQLGLPVTKIYKYDYDGDPEYGIIAFSKVMRSSDED